MYVLHSIVSSNESIGWDHIVFFQDKYVDIYPVFRINISLCKINSRLWWNLVYAAISVNFSIRLTMIFFPNIFTYTIFYISLIYSKGLHIKNIGWKVWKTGTIYMQLKEQENLNWIKLKTLKKGEDQVLSRVFCR